VSQEVRLAPLAAADVCNLPATDIYSDIYSARARRRRAGPTCYESTMPACPYCNGFHKPMMVCDAQRDTKLTPPGHAANAPTPPAAGTAKPPVAKPRPAAVVSVRGPNHPLKTNDDFQDDAVPKPVVVHATAKPAPSPKPAVVHEPAVVHTPQAVVHTVVHKPKRAGEDRYSDPDKRREYRRKWMAKKRVKPG
jgi:hypothetical protein